MNTTMYINESQTLSRIEQRQIDKAVSLLLRCPHRVRHAVLIAAANVGRNQHTLDAALLKLDGITAEAVSGFAAEHAA
ncbi:MAG: hypothetical protein GC191_14290 [Azospirillum sp.]|nr:hypothetical protein [Azospirillum sp.]